MPASVKLSIDTATIQRLVIEKLIDRQADSDAPSLVAPADDMSSREHPTRNDACGSHDDE